MLLVSFFVDSIIKNNNQEIRIGGEDTFIMLLWSRDAIAEVKNEIQAEQLNNNLISSRQAFQSDLATQNLDNTSLDDNNLQKQHETLNNEVPEKEE